MFAFTSAPILSVMYCLSAIFLQIFQNSHVMLTVTDAKFFAYFIDNINPYPANVEKMVSS